LRQHRRCDPPPKAVTCVSTTSWKRYGRSTSRPTELVIAILLAPGIERLERTTITTKGVRFSRRSVCPSNISTAMSSHAIEMWFVSISNANQNRRRRSFPAQARYAFRSRRPVMVQKAARRGSLRYTSDPLLGRSSLRPCNGTARAPVPLSGRRGKPVAFPF